MLVGRGRSLGDHPLPATATCLPVEVLPLRVAVAQITERIAERESASQKRLAVAQLDLGCVVPVEVGQIEEVVEDRDAAASRLLGIAQLQTLLQPGEARPTAVEGDDFPVCDEAVAVLCEQRFGQFRVGVVQELA